MGEIFEAMNRSRRERDATDSGATAPDGVEELGDTPAADETPRAGATHSLETDDALLDEPQQTASLGQRTSPPKPRAPTAAATAQQATSLATDGLDQVLADVLKSTQTEVGSAIKTTSTDIAKRIKTPTWHKWVYGAVGAVAGIIAGIGIKSSILDYSQERVEKVQKELNTQRTLVGTKEAEITTIKKQADDAGQKLAASQKTVDELQKKPPFSVQDSVLLMFNKTGRMTFTAPTSFMLGRDSKQLSEDLKNIGMAAVIKPVGPATVFYTDRALNNGRFCIIPDALLQTDENRAAILQGLESIRKDADIGTGTGVIAYRFNLVGDEVVVRKDPNADLGTDVTELAKIKVVIPTPDPK